MDYSNSLKTWTVLATDDVEEDLSKFVQYLLFEKMSEQAAFPSHNHWPMNIQ